MNSFRLVLFLLFSFQLYGDQLFHNDNIFIDKKTDSLEILSKSSIFIDKTMNLSLNEIKNKNFKKNNRSVLTYGMSPKFNVWIKVKLTNTTSKRLEKYIEYSNPLTTHVNFYDGDKLFRDGLYQINKERKSLNPVFKIFLKPKETKTVYIRASSKITTLIVRINLLNQNSLIEKTHAKDVALSMFFTAMVILVSYNLFIFFFTKDRSYLYYVLYMFGIIFHQSVYTGFGQIHLMSQEFSIYTIKYAGLVVALPVFFFALLMQSFLKTSQYPFINKIMVYYLIAFPFMTLSFLVFEELERFRNISSIFLLILIIFITVYAIIKKNRQAYFVLAGWVAVTFAFVFMYLSSAGVVDIFNELPYLAEVSLLFEAIIFSIALADRINQLEREKNIANTALIKKQQDEKVLLENVVKEKTKELQTTLNEKSLLLQELNHRVKNNMQTIVSLIRLQSDRIDDRKTNGILETIQNRINAMGTLHELLYEQSDISKIEPQKYFTMLVKELQRCYTRENIKINYQISSSLPVEKAVYCGLIINELVTNSFKYAFDNKEGKIDIILKKEDHDYSLIVQDNGKGYNESTAKENLGFILVKTLTANQLFGEIKKDTKDGVKVEIIWR